MDDSEHEINDSDEINPIQLNDINFPLVFLQHYKKGRLSF